MSLFNYSDLSKRRNVVPSPGSVIDSGTTSSFIGKVNQKIEADIGEIKQNDSKHFATKGDWSTHDLISYLLHITGPAKVYFTTWAISEFAIRKLYLLIEEGLITELSGIFDYRNDRHKTGELQFLTKITSNIKATKCHAKVTVIENDLWGICIVGSANFTRNPRIEAGVIATSRKTANFHKAWILNELNNKSSFERDNEHSDI